MMVFTWCGRHAKEHKLFWVALASISFAIVFGIRYNVGTDFPTYLNSYEQVALGNTGGDFEKWEWGVRTIFNLCAKIRLHYSIPFGIIAFIQIYLIFLGLRKQPKIWWFIPITLMFSCIWLSYSNIMRHMVAFSIFVLSIQFLASKQYLKYYICALIALLFHNSALLLFLIPIPYIFKYNYFNNIFYQLIIFGCAFIMMNINYAQQLLESLSVAIAMFGYDDYLTTSYAGFNEEASVGLGVLMLAVLSLVFIFNSNRMKLYYSSRTISIMYDLYFIGLIIRFAFARMFLLQRINYYFYSFEFIIGALMLGYFYYTKKRIWFIITVGIYFILFMGKMMQAEELTAMYHTFLDR